MFLAEEVQFSFKKKYLRSIIQYVFQNTRFLHNMQCVINIEYCCEKVQWLMLIAAFLEKERLLLKENAAYRLQSALKTRQSLE